MRKFVVGHTGDATWMVSKCTYTQGEDWYMWKFVRVGSIAGTSAGGLSSLIFSLIVIGVITYATYQPDDAGRTIYLWSFGSFVAFLIGILPSTLIGFVAGALTGGSFSWLRRTMPSLNLALALTAVVGIATGSSLLHLWFMTLGFQAEVVVAIGICIPAGIFTGWSLKKTSSYSV